MENLSSSVAQKLCVDSHFLNGDILLTTEHSLSNLIFLLLKKRFEVTVKPLSRLKIKETLDLLLPLLSVFISKFIIWLKSWSKADILFIGFIFQCEVTK